MTDVKMELLAIHSNICNCLILLGKVSTIGTVRNYLEAHLRQIVYDKDGVVDRSIVLVEMPLIRFEECWPLP